MSTRPTRLLALLLTAVVLGALSGCGGFGDSGDVARERPAPTHTLAGGRAPESSPNPTASTDDEATGRLPGLGPRTLDRVPDDARQVVVVTGEDRDSPRSTVVLHRRTDAGWRAGERWPAHNALRGWTDDHRLGDLRSPIGVFTLSDAGGLLPDPGTRLPYHRSDGFTIGGTGFEGEPLEGSFDYVVAIDYNRETGVSPLDWARPLGDSKGGGIWFHVDHDGPTKGCVSLSEAHMKALLRALDPALNPVVVMGDAASLAR